MSVPAGPHGAEEVPRTGVVAASAAGGPLARDLAAHLGARLHSGPARQALTAAWRAGHDRLVLVMALGAAVRLLAPLLRDKGSDPGVVCVDAAGRFAVSLTGAHEGGANTLAGDLARHLGATAVVTTAAEATGVPVLSTLGSRFGLSVEPGGDLAAVGAALAAGERVHLHRERPWPVGPLPGNVVEVAEPAPPLLLVSDRVGQGPRPAVVYRPPSLVVGVGASSGVSAEEVGGLVDAALAGAGLSPRAVAALATIDAKADEPGIVDAAAARGWPLHTLPAERLAGVPVPNPSPVVAAAVGTPSVAEAAALHSGGELVVEKHRSAAATVAVARRPPRGRLALVSLGPGDPAHLTGAAREELAHAEVVLGYRPYVDAAAAHTARGARLERYDLGQEVDRARRALDLARQGRAVALVSSGDVGVYAMASPALEEAGDDVDLVVLPGVTAAQAAAALLGAPLGHDHCAISLSDLMTPWEVIRRRLEAAAAADLVIALYNPRSRRRDWQLEEARRLLLAHRKGATPVGVVRKATRADQEVGLTTLDGLDTTRVDMHSIVVVGSTRTRVRHGRMVTPRGYA